MKRLASSWISILTEPHYFSMQCWKRSVVMLIQLPQCLAQRYLWSSPSSSVPKDRARVNSEFKNWTQNIYPLLKMFSKLLTWILFRIRLWKNLGNFYLLKRLIIFIITEPFDSYFSNKVIWSFSKRSTSIGIFILINLHRHQNLSNITRVKILVDLAWQSHRTVKC